MLKKIFSVTNCDGHKIFTVFGIKLKFRLNHEIEKSITQPEIPTMTSQLEYKKYILKFFPCEEMFPKGFYNDFILNDLTEKYIKLMQGLDEKSKKILNKTLYRIIQYAHFKQTKFFVDKKEYDKIIELLHPDLVQCIFPSNGYSAVNGYCVAGEINCGASVIYKHFIGDVIDKNKILNGDIIDAGAYNGDSALVLSDFTKGKIHAFEPESSNFKNLKKTIKINNLIDKIIPVKMGLGEKEDIKMLKNFNGNTIGASFCIEDAKETDCEEASITTIDNYVKRNNINKIGLIKTDVEGYEQNLLHGAIETIKKHKPVLMISIYHNFDDFWNIKPLIESWNMGYQFKIRKPYSLDFCGDMILIAETANEKVAVYETI